MYISNQAGFASGTWGSNPFLQVNSPKVGILGKNAPMQDVLGRMSENLLDARQQPSLRDRVEMEFSGILDTEYSALSEVPTDVLKFFAATLDMYARFNSMTEHALTEYRDQLTAFDQTIQEYQDMLDVGNICYPFAVGPVRMELPVQQILVLVYLLPHLLPFPASADF